MYNFTFIEFYHFSRGATPCGMQDLSSPCPAYTPVAFCTLHYFRLFTLLYLGVFVISEGI